VSLNVPIFSSFARSARTQQAKIALEKAKTDLTETEQKLKLAYQNAKSDYEYSVEQYNSSKENLKLAERIEKNKKSNSKKDFQAALILRKRNVNCTLHNKTICKPWWM